MEAYRVAAKEAIMQLGHEPVMAENFGARAHSPQIACLDGVRQSSLIILLLRADYSAKQSSGISATHEEYREAKGTHPIIALVQENVKADTDQKKFMDEVQNWQAGLFRGGFDSPEKLKVIITLAIHEWQLSTAVGPLNADELRQLAINSVLEEQGNRAGRLSIILSIVGGPVQSILRPSEIEKPLLAEELLQAALFGHNKIFSTDIGSKKAIEGDSLLLQQEERTRIIKLDPQGGLVFRLKIDLSRTGIVNQ
jgi:hypothetical protein